MVAAVEPEGDVQDEAQDEVQDGVVPVQDGQEQAEQGASEHGTDAAEAAWRAEWAPELEQLPPAAQPGPKHGRNIWTVKGPNEAVELSGLCD